MIRELTEAKPQLSQRKIKREIAYSEKSSIAEYFQYINCKNSAN